VDPLYDTTLGWGMFDAIFNQFMNGVGELSDGSYQGYQGWVIWLFFFLSTVFTQLLFVNMLVALMGKTLEVVFEKGQEYKLQWKTKYETDNISFVFSDWKNFKTLERYLFCVEPQIQQGDDDEEAKQESIQENISIVEEQVKDSEHAIGTLWQRQSTISSNVEDLQDKLFAVQ